MIYFDNATFCKPLPETIEFAQKQISEFYGDSFQIYSEGQKTKAVLEFYRSELALLINSSSSSIFFTSGQTESNNIIANSLQIGDYNSIITSIYEHESVLKSLKFVGSKLNIPLLFVENEIDTGVSLIDLDKILYKNPHSFVSFSHVNRLTGRLLPVKRVVKTIRKYSSVFHCDMSDSLGKLPIDFKNLDIDVITGNSTNVGAISGSGFICAKNDFHLQSVFFLGRNNELGIRPGIENVPAISSMIFALKKSIEKIDENWEYLIKLKSNLKTELESNQVKYSSVSFSEKNFLPHFANLEMINIKNFDIFLIKLDLKNVSVFDSRNELTNMFNNIRISLSPQNTKEEIKLFCQILGSFVD
ncbi:MAG: aminotransferase class V-fold PLP-dependent enzyme [Bacteroidales bacterium]|nr:aminotransferase class V-fold PLP-dependent enzyme [Bacteroidales bacterium]